MSNKEGFQTSEQIKKRIDEERQFPSYLVEVIEPFSPWRSFRPGGQARCTDLATSRRWEVDSRALLRAKDIN